MFTKFYRLSVGIFLFCVIPVINAQSLNFNDPESAGLSIAGLEKVTQRLQRHIVDGDISGVVATVIRDGKIVYSEALGQRDIEKSLPMTDDTLFRIYSMTREITSVAVLQLYEQGKFKLNDPIKMYLPEFENQQVLLDSDKTDLSQTRARTGDITVAHLLTHTSGLGSRSSALYTENQVRDKNITLDQMTSNAARIPLFQDPGTEFRYGIHATILGKLIEVWSGEELLSYLGKNIFEPLGMNNTMFWAQGDDADKLAQLYRPTGGSLVPYQIETIPFTTKPRLIEGGVGLLSTVKDFANFAQMVMNHGEFNGKQILKPETAALIFENGVPEAAMPIGTRGYWAGSGWTFGGFNLVLDPTSYSFPVSEGTIWWDGSAGTRFFIDAKQKLITIIMGQVSPSNGGGFREEFSIGVDAAIVDRY